ncbi:porphobilinogen synthase [Rhizosphaericola mali]|uniref:Delta-aminolevulinic acid dehydratase n=1 Tax=Rhizosphaericola mali TaxID=2545455 RepID=A0A5P2GD97_9BACT|nr:porphobilinogen synthase [Rhizosphaericola mali]QES89571.1 porphobilinogen synthase [Rhizosphaericola mali]
MYLQRRNRTLRRNESIRSLVRETILTPNDFMAPVFIGEGKGEKHEIPSMPGYYRYSLDLMIKEVKELYSVGVKAINPYVKASDNLKDNTGKESWNPNGLMQTSIRAIKDAVPEMIIMSDVALDPYSIYGHDGIIENGDIVNDATIEALTKMSLSHAEAGVDFVAPSDMMDGRVAAFRKAFEENGYSHVGIMTYAAKYASCFYGPFRDALDSAPVDSQNIPKNKKTYQMDPANRTEAIKETLDDIAEGADIVMVKPAMAYLDILREVRNAVNVPVSAYQVSGEYAMIKAAAQNGWLDEKVTMMESLTCIKRAGADIISTYFAKEAAMLLNG